MRPVLIVGLLAGLLIFILNKQFPDALNSSANQQNLVYGLLLLSVVGSSVLMHYRGRLNLALNYAAIWILLTMILVIGYGFKDRLQSALLPSRAYQNEVGELNFSAAEDGHFYIDARVNDVPVRFMVDTGATSIVLDQRTAERVGIDVANLNYNQRVSTANGFGMGASTILDSIEINGFRVSSMRASVNQAGLDYPLLGMSFLQKLKGWRVEGETLTFIP